MGLYIEGLMKPSAGTAPASEGSGQVGCTPPFSLLTHGPSSAPLSASGSFPLPIMSGFLSFSTQMVEKGPCRPQPGVTTDSRCPSLCS